MEITKTQMILQSYTFKILGYYVEHKQLPSIAELKRMQQEAIDDPLPETTNLGNRREK